MREKIQALIDSTFNANEVAKATGIPVNTVYRIFTGEAKLENITLKNAEILSKYWEENKMKNYEIALEVVKKALQDSEVYNLAVAFAEENDGTLVEQIVAEQINEAAKNTDVFNMSVEKYLFTRLDAELEVNPEVATMQNADKFESEEEAEEQGFYWEDSVSKWLKLDFNK